MNDDWYVKFEFTFSSKGIRTSVSNSGDKVDSGKTNYLETQAMALQEPKAILHHNSLFDSPITWILLFSVLGLFVLFIAFWMDSSDRLNEAIEDLAERTV